MRRPICALCLVCLPIPALAQPLEWSDLIAPDRVMRSLVQSGLLALRSQIDLRWSDMSVDLRRGTVRLSDMRASPQMQGQDPGDCQIRARDAEIQLFDYDRPDTVRFEIRLSDIDAGSGCVPPQARMPLSLMGIRSIALPMVRTTFDYDIPSGSADLTVFAQMDDALAATMTARFDYAWFDVDPNDPQGEPDPDFRLDRVRLELEDLGAWSVIAPLLPPPLTDPKTGGAMLEALIAQRFGPDPAVAEFAETVSDGWAAFLDDPARLIVESTNTAPVRLEFDAYASNPVMVLRDLQPRLGAASTTAPELLAADILQNALNFPDALSGGDRTHAILAFATGRGIPQDVERALSLLNGMDHEPGAETLAVVAQALRAAQPNKAYALALRAQMPALLDKIESELPLGAILQAQPDDDIELGTPSLPAIRAAALAALSGADRPRSYRDALVLARIGDAAGDPVAADIVARIAARFGNEDGWDDLSATATERALGIWSKHGLSELLSRR